MSTIRAFLGGSFDPVHLGHMMMACHVFKQLSTHFATCKVQVYLLPTAGNPFKGQPTCTQHRLAMLKLATQDTPIHIHEYEIHQPPPVYTIDTVRHFASLYPDDRLIFIMGKDSLLALPTWKDGQKILHHANLWVFDRDITPSQTLDKTLATHLSNDINQLLTHTGVIYQDTTPIMSISSSHIRQLLTQNPSLAEPFLSPKVLAYLTSHALYG